MSTPPLNLVTLCKSYGIALTGGIATGKSVVASILKRKGEIVIDADELARHAVEPGKKAHALLAQEFGTTIFLPDGTIDRDALRRNVLQAPAARTKLENITHPAIQEELFLQLKHHGLTQAPRRWFYEAALIVEKNRLKDFRTSLCTLCTPETQLQRLKTRLHLSAAETQGFLASQLSAADKARQCDHVIDTEGSLASVEQQIDDFLVATP